MRAVRILPLPVLLLIIGPCAAEAGKGSGGGRPNVDSVLAIPYNDMVRDLGASHTLYLDALARARASGDRLAEGRLRQQLSTITYLEGQFDSAVYHGHAAERIYRELGDMERLGGMLCDLGFGMKRRDLDRAFVLYRQGLAILEEIEPPPNLSRAYNNFAPLYEMRGDLDSAFHYARMGLVETETFHDSTGLPYSLNRVAGYLMTRGNFDEALALFQRADTIRRLTDDLHGLADQQAYFGDLYQAAGDHQRAIVHFDRSLERSTALSYAYLRQYCLERLAECYEAVGDPAAALHATRAAHAIKDSLQNEKNSRTIIELEGRYKVAEKDRAIAELGATAERRRFYTWLGLAAVVVAFALGLLLHQHRQRRLRAERDAAIIAEREAGLKAVFEATETERGRLARELHDGIGQQLGGLKHRLEALREKAPLGEVIGIVDDTSREVRDLAHQMMPKALVRLGLVPAMDEMVQRAFKGSAVKAGFDHFGMEAPMAPEAATGLYRIAQELISNVLKHAKATEVDIQLFRNKDHIVLMVQDNGMGYDPARRSQGIGLMNIADRSRALGGTFDMDGSVGGGTLSTVRIPATTPSRT